MSARYGSFVALGAALVLALPASAQQGAGAAVAIGPVAAVAHFAPSAPTPDLSQVPTGDSGLLGLRLLPVSAPAAFPLPVPVQSQGRQSQNVALMIVGGAALVVGSLIDGDTGSIIMVGGAVAGLVGLFRYLG